MINIQDKWNKYKMEGKAGQSCTLCPAESWELRAYPPLWLKMGKFWKAQFSCFLYLVYLFNSDSYYFFFPHDGNRAWSFTHQGKADQRGTTQPSYLLTVYYFLFRGRILQSSPASLGISSPLPPAPSPSVSLQLRQVLWSSCLNLPSSWDNRPEVPKPAQPGM